MLFRVKPSPRVVAYTIRVRVRVRVRVTARVRSELNHAPELFLTLSPRITQVTLKVRVIRPRVRMELVKG